MASFYIDISSRRWIFYDSYACEWELDWKSSQIFSKNTWKKFTFAKNCHWRTIWNIVTRYFRNGFSIFFVNDAQLLGWIPRNFKIFKILGFFTEFTLNIIYQIFRENSHYRNVHFQEHRENHLYGDFVKIREFTLVISFMFFPQNLNFKGFKMKVLKFLRIQPNNGTILKDPLFENCTNVWCHENESSEVKLGGSNRFHSESNPRLLLKWTLWI